jgi:hypothetical protein
MANGRTPGSRHSVVSTRSQRVGMLGTRSTKPIGASGHTRPHQQAGYMTAPDHVAALTCPCEKETVHT